MGVTGHAEVVQVTYNPDQVGLRGGKRGTGRKRAEVGGCDMDMAFGNPSTVRMAFVRCDSPALLSLALHIAPHSWCEEGGGYMGVTRHAEVVQVTLTGCDGVGKGHRGDHQGAGLGTWRGLLGCWRGGTTERTSRGGGG